MEESEFAVVGNTDGEIFTISIDDNGLDENSVDENNVDGGEYPRHALDTPSTPVFLPPVSIGTIPAGIRCISLSPTSEVVLIYTTNDTLLTFRSDMQPLHEHPYPAQSALSEPVEIAWAGDGERFVVATTDDNGAAASDDGANNATKNDNKNDNRILRVFTTVEPGVTKAICRKEDGTLVTGILPNSVGWSTNSTLITAVQVVREKLQTIFFEPNGLRHREFTIRGCNAEEWNISNVGWDCESELLGILLVKKSGEESILQLYHRNNYHWYLKHSIPSTSRGDVVKSFRFDAERRGQLTILLASSKIRSMHFHWDMTVNNDDVSCGALVVDGEEIHSTKLGRAVVPPPMAGEIIRTKDCALINAVAHMDEFFVALTATDEILLFRGDDSRKLVLKDGFVLSKSITLRQIVCLQGDDESTKSVITIGNDVATNVESIVEFSFQVASFDGDLDGIPATVTVTPVVLSPGESPLDSDLDYSSRVLRIIPDLSSDRALISLDDGSLYVYVIKASLSQLPIRMLEPCIWIAVLDATDGEYTCVGLSNRNRLYCGDQLVCASSSCFAFSREHKQLIYVTLGSRAQLRFQHSSVMLSFDPLAGSEAMEEALMREVGYEPRNVERGSRIVGCVGVEPLVVLQHPRGNLENVYPRALTLSLCRKYLDARDYKKAFKLMRTHRIDTNLVVDHDPSLFLRNIDRFVRKVKNVDFLNLFISYLQDVDFTATKYVAPSWATKTRETSDFNFDEKVNLVCTSMRASMLGSKEGVQQFLLPILSTFAKQKPPKLEEALTLIMSETESRNLSLDDSFAQDSIKYLAFLASYKVLYDTAKGLYDFQLAKSIARNSQMDPRVYMVEIEKLSAMDELSARYTVDVSLSRWEKALVSLHALDKNEENQRLALSLIKEHSLEKEALSLYSSSDDGVVRREIVLILARRKYKEQHYQVATNLFLSVHPPALQEAIEAATNASDWKAIFTYCCTSSEEMENLGGTIVEMFSEDTTSSGGEQAKLNAAQICLDYCNNDYQSAIKILVSGNCWTEATRIARKNDASTSTIRNAAKSFASEVAIELTERSESLEKYFKRFLHVRELRAEARRVEEENFAAGRGEDGRMGLTGDSGSSFSVGTGDMSNLSTFSSSSMGSTYSINSAYSGTGSGFSMSRSEITGGASNVTQSAKKSAKEAKKIKEKARRNRRREMKKMRPGSQEDFKQLISTVKSLLIGVDEARRIGETIVYLVREREVVLAIELREAVKSFVKMFAELECGGIVLKEEEVGEEGLVGEESPFVSYNLDNSVAELIDVFT